MAGLSYVAGSPMQRSSRADRLVQGPLAWLLHRASVIKWTVVVAAVLANALKGIAPGASSLMWPYWVVTYRHGFIRRGLAGTVFQSIVEGMSIDEQQRLVLGFHFVLYLALAAGLLAWSITLMHGASARVRLLLATGTAALFLSAFFPSFGWTTGYLDPYVLALAGAGAFLAFRRSPMAAGLIAMVGPLIHDEFLFVWLPVLGCCVSDVLASNDRPRAVRRFLPITLPILSELLVLWLHSPSALARSLAELPPEWRGIGVFELSLRDAVLRMYDVTMANAERLGLAMAFFGWPPLVTASCAVALAPGPTRRRVIMVAMTTLSPCAILLVAWDLSRYLVWTSFSAFLVLCWSARAARASSSEGEPAPSRRSVWTSNLALAALVLCAAGGPSLFSYFHHAHADYRLGPRWLRFTPAARISYAWLGIYNRDHIVRAWSSADGCKMEAQNVRSVAPEGCAFELQPGSLVETPLLGLARGAYTARIAIEPLDLCNDATGELAVHLRWRLASPKPSVSVDARSMQTASLDFAIDAEESAMGSVRVDVSTRAGCFRLVSMVITRRGE